MDKTCKWKQDEWYDFYETACGHIFGIVSGTPQDNTMKYCPYCGRKIKECKEN